MGAGDFPEYVQVGWWIDGRGESIEIVPSDRGLVARCSECQGVVDWRWVAPTARVRHRDRDVLVSDDCRLIISRRCRARLPDADTSFEPLPNDSEFVLVVPDQRVERDPEEMVLFSGDACSECGRLRDVSSPAEFVLKAPPPAGLSRTDIEFGPYWLKAPRICVGLELADQLVAHDVRGLRLLPVYVERLKLGP